MPAVLIAQKIVAKKYVVFGISKIFTQFSKFGFSSLSNHNFKYVNIMLNCFTKYLPNCCAKWIFGIILHQIAARKNICDEYAPNFVQVTVLRQRPFRNNPQIHPGATAESFTQAN
jgi:hypothetical protein